MGKHTPAPWAIGMVQTTGIYNPNTVFANGGQDGIAQVHGIPMHAELAQIEKDERWENGLANARLIAAAPELLAAAEAVARTEMFLPDHPQRITAYKQMRSAIAKATST